MNSSKDREIIEFYRQFVSAEAPACLATLVRARGSSYSRPGARMLILADGRSAGSISSGCLEQDLVLRAQEMLADYSHHRGSDSTALTVPEPRLLIYQTSYLQDELPSFETGCPGTVELLLEIVDASKKNNPVLLLAELIEEVSRTGIEQVRATVLKGSAMLAGLKGGRIVSVSGRSDRTSAELEFVSRLADYSDLLQNVLAACLDAGYVGAFHAEIIDAFGRRKENAGSEYLLLEAGEEKMELFLERLLPQKELVIFGALYDSCALAELALKTGFDLSICDYRRGLLNDCRLSRQAKMHLIKPEDPASFPLLTKHSYALLMTHNYLADKQIFAGIIGSPCSYIGMLGPKRRSEAIITELQNAGLSIGKDALKKVHAPAGLDTGGEGPEAIAVSIMAELQAVINKREGGFLHLRQDSIYEPQAERKRVMLVGREIERKEELAGQTNGVGAKKASPGANK